MLNQEDKDYLKIRILTTEVTTTSKQELLDGTTKYVTVKVSCVFAQFTHLLHVSIDSQLYICARRASAESLKERQLDMLSENAWIFYPKEPNFLSLDGLLMQAHLLAILPLRVTVLRMTVVL